MPVSAIISLLTTFGPPAVNLITTLISKWETNGAVTSEEWSALTAQLQQTAQQRMQAQLAAAGIDPSSPHGVAMLELAK